MNLVVAILLIMNLSWSIYLTYLFTKKVKDKSSSNTSNQKDNLLAYPKINLVRFNPFEELGGDQSFILVLLDSHLDGVIVTSLHAKDTTRVYAKPIRNGQADNVTLSKEEKVALAKAVKN